MRACNASPDGYGHHFVPVSNVLTCRWCGISQLDSERHLIRTMTTDGILDSEIFVPTHKAWAEWEAVERDLANGYVAQLIDPSDNVIAEATRTLEDN